MNCGKRRIMNTRSSSQSQGAQAAQRKRQHSATSSNTAAPEKVVQFFSAAPPQHRLQRERFIDNEKARVPFEIDGRSTRLNLKKVCASTDSMQIGNKSYEYLNHEEEDDESLWRYARKYWKLKNEKFGKVNITLPTDDNMDEAWTASLRMMAQFTCRETFGNVDDKTFMRKGMSLLEEKRNKASEKEKKAAEKKIEKIIKDAVSHHLLKASKQRREIKVSDLSVFANSDMVPHMEQAPMENFFFNYIKNNDLVPTQHKKGYMAIQDQLKADEDKHKCDCGDGPCDASTCICYKYQRQFRYVGGSGHQFKNVYSCSPLCACKGSCIQSFPKPPVNGTEAVMHPSGVKGVALRSRQFFAWGESVSGFKGEIIRDEDAQDSQYAFDYFKSETEGEVVLKFLEKNEQSVKKFKIPIDKKYAERLEKVVKQNLSIEPLRKGCHGRYLASSCLGNLRPNIIWMNGLNPANCEVTFSATMPIFPIQELTFMYSVEYIYSHLRDICQCGELCCVTNRTIFPFITKDHVRRYYKLLYEALYKEFEKKVLLWQGE